MGLFDGGGGLGGLAALASPLTFMTSAGEMAGTYMQNQANAGMMDKANDFNAWQADLNRGFQERVSSTAHQREVEDLKKAGLNPILSANAGASTPSGSSASSVAPPEMKNLISPALASARQMMQMTADLQKTGAEIDLLKSQKSKADVDTEVAKKGVPESELKNDFYDILRPYVKKMKEGLSSNAVSEKRSPENAKKFFNMSKP